MHRTSLFFVPKLKISENIFFPEEGFLSYFSVNKMCVECGNDTFISAHVHHILGLMFGDILHGLQPNLSLN